MTALFRKVIKIRAEDSPNVRLAMAMQARGLTPDGRQVIPGVLGWDEYLLRRATWDIVRQTVGLDADFYRGAEILLFPPERLNRASDLYRTRGNGRKGKAGSCDPGEGIANTVICAGDEYGLLELDSRKTPDTSVIAGNSIAFMKKWKIPPENFVFDRGGGGKQIADLLRAKGYPVRTVSFGETLSPDPKYGNTTPTERMGQKEGRTAYVNRRAEMYGRLAEWLDPSLCQDGMQPDGWEVACGFRKEPYRGYALPDDGTPALVELRRQLALIPRLYDREGQMFLPPKNRKPGQKENSGQKTLTEILGRSPDEADAVVMLLYALCNPSTSNVIGSLF